MSDAERDFENLTCYLMGAGHEQLLMLAGALARELIARGHPADTAACETVAQLRRQLSTPRAERLARPA